MRQFITNMLKIQEDKIEELQTIAQSEVLSIVLRNFLQTS